MYGVWINYITLHGYMLATMGNNNDKDNKEQDVLRSLKEMGFTL